MAMVSADDVFYCFLFLVWFLAALLVHSLIKACFKHKPRSKIPPPPSPFSLPFLGHLHLIGPILTKSLQGLARNHGPLIHLRLGASSCVVASSASVAREMLKTQELNFLSRPEFGSSEHFIYKGSRFIMSPYGDYWRFMKKLCMTRLLAVPQLEKFLNVREEEVQRLVESVVASARAGKASDLSKELMTFSNNMICRMVMSTRCSGTENDAKEIHEIVQACMELAGKLSVGDVLGPLRWLDFSGNGKKLEAVLWEFDRIVERVMKEHEEKLISGSVAERKDLMDILLETHHDPNAEMKITRDEMKSFLLDIFMAGTDTTSVATQWAMAELINCPEAYKKLQDEINSVVGPARLVREPDIPNLPYLRAVVRETLRLHPSAPIILRECGEDCSVNGYLVEAESRVIVNVYAIMRDPEAWTDPDEFAPERFLESSDEKIGEHQMELKGQNFRYLPFGSGRRGCPGASLAMLVVYAAVGALVQCFDWKMMDGEVAVDLSQGSGFAAEMAKPLVCYPILRVNPYDLCR
ncbi:hypothetical protein BT93_K1229 [Corymbia citriodora subsp. variegata]|nr:hypothetical protein BT93_K1229 [Corymbia citriodora subsp. variegata]